MFMLDTLFVVVILAAVLLYILKTGYEGMS